MLSLADELSGVCTDEFWKADAGLEFADLLHVIVQRARQASFRFQEAAGIYGTSDLSGYAGRLADAQDQADRLLGQARTESDLLDLSLDLMPAHPVQGSPLDIAQIKLQQIVAQLAADGAAATAALNYLTANDGLTDDGRRLPLDESEQDRFAAVADAQNLGLVVHGGQPSAAFLASLGLAPGASKQAILAAIAKDASSHRADAGFLQDFFDHASPDLAALARSLTRVHGGQTVALDGPSQDVLSQFGGLLAAATSTSSLSPKALAQLGAAADPWSIAMLLKFGPSGTAYGKGQGSRLLATLTQNIEHQVQADGYIPHPAWPPGQEPLGPVLARATENGEAARIALGDGSPLAAELAHDLLACQTVHDFGYQGDGPDKEWIRNDNGTADGNAEANFLLAAGIPPVRDGSDPYSLSAALNVFSAAADIHQQHPGAVPLDPVRVALQAYTAAYVDDLAFSASTNQRENLPDVPLVSLVDHDVKTILDFAYGSDSDAWKQFRTGIVNQAVDALAATGGHMAEPPLTSYLRLAKLYGVTGDLQADWQKAGATSLDQAASNRLALANAMLGTFGNTSFDGAAHPSTQFTQPVTGGVAPLLENIAPSWFATNHVDGVTSLIQQANDKTDVSFQVLAAKALLKSGTLDPALAADLAAKMPDRHGGDTGRFLYWYGQHETDPHYSLNGDKLSTIYTNMQQQFDRQQHA